MQDESLVHLKMDGDGIGDRFRTHSLGDFPWLSVQLARMVQQRLVAGVQTALAHCPPVKGAAGPTLPVDVVYVGGDDVYVVLPELLMKPFLDGFGGTVASAGNNPWKDASFTFIAARLKPKAELLAGLERMNGGSGSGPSNRLAAANHAAARLVTEGLEAVKKDFKGETSLDAHALQETVDKALVASQLDGHGMKLELVPERQSYGVVFADGRSLLRGRSFVVGPPVSGD